MDAEERTRRIGQLDLKQIRGRQAESLLMGIKPFLAEMREEYLKQLVQRTKAAGEADTFTAMLLTALEDIEIHLERRLHEGVAARKKMERLTKEAGGSE